jgi:hypothetical protein
MKNKKEIIKRYTEMKDEPLTACADYLEFEIIKQTVNLKNLQWEFNLINSIKDLRYLKKVQSELFIDNEK